MWQLRNILEDVRAGHFSFKPADSSDYAFVQFQSVANRLKAMLDKGLVHDVKFLKSSSRSKPGFVAAMVVGGLTFEGEQFLLQPSSGEDFLRGNLANNYQMSPVTELGGAMKVFISHSSIDTKVAEAFLDLLRSALDIQPEDIRCTSVSGYKLAAGIDINEQLRQEVFESVAFVALLSPASLKSTYVQFELGARWGAKKYLAPILISGIKSTQLSSPLSTIHSISGTSNSDVLQLLDSLREIVSVKMQKPHTFSKALSAFIEASAIVNP